MEKFDYPVIVAHLKKIKPLVHGLYFQRLTQVSPCDFAFSLSQKDKHLFISLNQQNPFIDWVDGKIAALKREQDTHLTTIIRHHLEKGKITNIEVLEGQKVIVISIEKHYENLTVGHYKIYLELIVNHANMIVCDDNDDIQAVYKSSKDFSGNRILRIHQPYRIPPIQNPFKGFNDNFKLGYFYQSYQSEFSDQLRQTNFRVLFNKVKTTIERLNSKKTKINQEVMGLIPEDQARLYGQLLLTHQPPITGKVIQIEEIDIPVDPDLDAVKNADKWFNKAKKVRLTKGAKQSQLDLIEEEIKYYQDLAFSIKHMTNEELQEVEVELGIKPLIRYKHQDAKSFKPYYVIFNQVKIGFGKNNLQNDYLTFKLAENRDTFLHIKNQPGSHIIIFNPNPSEEVIEYAGRLGLYLAGVPSAEFTLAKRQKIKKGPFPGSVIINEAKSIFIREKDTIKIDPAQIKRF